MHTNVGFGVVIIWCEEGHKTKIMYKNITNFMQ